MGIDVTIFLVNLKHLESKVKALLESDKYRSIVEAIEKQMSAEQESEDQSNDDEQVMETTESSTIDSTDISERASYTPCELQPNEAEILSDLKSDIQELDPSMKYLCDFRSRATEHISELANKLEFPEVWSNEELLENLLHHSGTFKSDMHWYKQEAELSAIQYPNLFRACVLHGLTSEYVFNFIHPIHVRELSEKCNHARDYPSIPMELIEKVYTEENKTNENDESTSKKKKLDNEELYNWFDDRYEHHLFSSMVKLYNDPIYVLKLFEVPIIEQDRVNVKKSTKGAYKDLSHDNWTDIMTFVDNPVTLLRLAKSCKVLNDIFMEKRDELFDILKEDIGLFTRLD